jgi:hypothetical protein
MKFKDNLECIHCELNMWDYDDYGGQYPLAYQLTFKFYGTIVTAWINVSELQTGGFASVETDGELLASFDEVFENHNYFIDKIRKVCKECWENVLDNIHYDFEGNAISS